ncbi:DNA-cytosine methyltransferase [Caldithrix abyssi DSM 13497]|uniref:Cytosine-specific methyltransferase n=1 Tax=Caldithrix abyssi DSM 13497 TaxID=880073 RepID=H1XUR8_CALAY|nr:DNA cytosine methyltransferase [Caldithrix abyssi]APF17521.1 DNA (cytosine-5)-methyltransferase 1 [Caldithrix abyssi DSM 13497]EHO41617.1 DNA-cytosine methyltransferase [Caldithrix abyssi DSM 13497]
MDHKFTYIELFAGAGGLSEGFIRAGFRPVFHIEMDRYAALTLKTRIAYHYLKGKGKIEIYNKYITGRITGDELYKYVPDYELDSVVNEEIRDDNVEKLFRIIKNHMLINNVSKINVIAGGPPCQAYSIIGRARDPYRMKYDKRNYLYKLYVRFLNEFRPDVFVFENVPGLISAADGKLWEDVKKYFMESGYEIGFKLLNAHDFGVLQNRKRVIVIGWRKELNLKYPEFSPDKNVAKFKVHDILDDLPPLEPGERITVGKYIKPPSKYLFDYGIRNGWNTLIQHIARGHNERDRKIYKFYIENWRKEKRRPDYDELPEELKTHKNRKVFRDRFKVVASDLPYSQTIVAHLAKDGHYFIHPDINQLRSISVREAARIQSFPDNFYFEGPMTEMFRQIGNAVPPLMAEKMAEKVKEMLK